MTMLPHGILLSILLVLVLYPVVVSQSLTPPGTYYPKIHGLVQNYYFYLSIIKQGRDSWFPINQYTTFGIASDPLHFYYIFLGKIGSVLAISDAGIYWIGVVSAVILLYVATWMMIRRFVTKQYRWIAMILIFLLNPLPAITVPLGPWKLYIGAHPWTAMDIFSRISRVPHHGMGIALSLFGVYSCLSFYQTQRFRYALLSGLLFFLASVTSFISVAIILFALILSFVPFGVIQLHQLIRERIDRVAIGELWQRNRQFFWGTCYITIVAMIPIVVFTILENRMGFISYEYTLFKANVFPDTLAVFLACAGFLWLFFPFMLWFVFRVKRWGALFLLLLFLSPFILYECSALGILPVNKQRWALYPLYQYGGLIAMMSTAYVFRRASVQTVRVVKTIIVCCIALTTIIGIRDYYVPLLAAPGVYTNTYLSKQARDAMTFLKTHTPRYSRVMTTFYIGMYIPAFTYNVVYIGHEAADTHFWGKWPIAADFFSEVTPAGDAKQFLKDQKMQYVIWDVGPIPPSYLTFLTPIWNTTGITIYQVKR
jgi:hypothetical protein